MPSNVDRFLIRSITFARNPACRDTNGEIEHWKIEVWGLTKKTKEPFEVTGELEFVTIPERWDGFTPIPAHQIEIPGVRLSTTALRTFQEAAELANTRALCVSGYMGPDFPHILSIVRDYRVNPTSGDIRSSRVGH
jgi:hypothetical protein